MAYPCAPPLFNLYSCHQCPDSWSLVPSCFFLPVYINVQYKVTCKLRLTCMSPYRSAVQHPTSHRPRLLLVGRPRAAQTSHLGPALLHALEGLAIHRLDLAALFRTSSISPEEACTQVWPMFRLSFLLKMLPLTPAGDSVQLRLM